jgi:hypothetical protein
MPRDVFNLITRCPVRSEKEDGKDLEGAIHFYSRSPLTYTKFISILDEYFLRCLPFPWPLHKSCHSPRPRPTPPSSVPISPLATSYPTAPSGTPRSQIWETARECRDSTMHKSDSKVEHLLLFRLVFCFTI